jgi:hypothetical protein
MKLISLVFFLIFICSFQQTAFSQKWCEPGAEWIHAEFYLWHYPPFKVRFFHQKDTLIENQVCQKILRQGISGVYCTDTVVNERDSYFTYYNSDTVWFYYDNAFRPVYMFNVQVGDTHVLRDYKYEEIDSTTTYVVQSVGYDVVDGDTLRSYTMKMLKDTILELPLIKISERIGAHEIIFIPKDRSWYLDGESWGFVCYNDERINFEGLSSHLTCDPCNRAVGVAEHSAQKELVVYPNPFEHSIRIEKAELYPDADVVVTDLSGRVVHQQKLSTEIDLHFLISGMYVISISHDTYKKQFKLLKSN